MVLKYCFSIELISKDPIKMKNITRNEMFQFAITDQSSKSKCIT